jgi:hypothetical protein
MNLEPTYTHEYHLDDLKVIVVQFGADLTGAVAAHDSFVKEIKRTNNKYLSAVFDDRRAVIQRAGRLSHTDHGNLDQETLGGGWIRSTLTVPGERGKLLMKRLQKVAMAAVELGFPEPRIECLGTNITTDAQTGRAFRSATYQIDWVASVRCGEWSFAGRLHIEEAGAVVTEALGYSGPEIPLECREGHEEGIRCDHCGFKRKRKDGWIVYNDSEDTFEIVGRSCLVDYLGVGPASQIKCMYRFIKRMKKLLNVKLIEEPSTWAGWDTLLYLTYSAAAIRDKGEFRRSRDANSTYVDAFNRMQWDAQTAQTDASAPRRWRPRTEDRKAAMEALSWGANLDPKGVEYLANIKTICCSAHLTHDRRTLAIAASIPYAHRRALAKAEHALEEASRGTHVGRAGETIIRDVVFTRFSQFEGRYGPSRVLKFKTLDDHSILTWFSNSRVAREICERVNEIMRISAKVKEHRPGYRNGPPETIITYVKLEKSEPAAEPVPRRPTPKSNGFSISREDIRNSEWSERGEMLAEELFP